MSKQMIRRETELALVRKLADAAARREAGRHAGVHVDLFDGRFTDRSRASLG